jgi:hypothetical protein
MDQLRAGEDPVPERALARRPLAGGSGEGEFRLVMEGDDG